MKNYQLKHSILFLLLLVVSYKLNAQDLEKKNTFGVIAGISGSSITNYNGKLFLWFTGGLYWEWKFSDRFAYQTPGISRCRTRSVYST